MLRLALGSALSMALACGLAWPLAFITPVLVATFLGTPAPGPDLRGGLGIVLAIAAGCGLGFLLALVTVHYPLLCLVLIALSLFLIFYANALGVSPFLVVMAIIGVTVIPMMGIQSQAAAWGLAVGLFACGGVAILIVWFMHALVPASAQIPPPSSAKAGAGAVEAWHQAALGTLVVMPVLLVFYVFGLTSLLLVLALIAMLAQQPDLNTGIKGSALLIIGNTLGGLAAIVFYELLVLVPAFEFLVLLSLLVGLVFARRIFSDRPLHVAVYGTAFSTLLLLVASSTTAMGDEAQIRFYVRIFQIVLAGAYVVTAFYLLKRISGWRRHVAAPA